MTVRVNRVVRVDRVAGPDVVPTVNAPLVNQDIEAAVGAISLDEVHPDEVTTPVPEGPPWVWAKVAAEEDLSGINVLEVRSALPEVEPVVPLRAVGAIVEQVLQRHSSFRERPQAADRNLVTVPEFAEALKIAPSSVWELINLGLPSMKADKVGRRIKKAEAVAWLTAGGPKGSRIAKRMAKARGGSGG